jgi:hypothetical protein
MSTTSVAEKLLIEANTTLWASSAPRLDLIGPLPDGVRRVDTLDAAATAIVFVDDAASLRESPAAHRDRPGQPNTLWIAHPKRNRADINRDTLWPMVAPYRMRRLAVAASVTPSGTKARAR